MVVAKFPLGKPSKNQRGAVKGALGERHAECGRDGSILVGISMQTQILFSPRSARIREFRSMRKRMDRFIHDALQDFADWYVADPSAWLGKERDCVNTFALQYLIKKIDSTSAIKDVGQIRIECAVMQPSKSGKFIRPSATKDLVVWSKPSDTTWGVDWKPVNAPRAIMEWKTSRSGGGAEDFDVHDVEWLTAFTEEYPKTIGFLVSTHATKSVRRCTWAMVRCGIIGKRHTLTT